MRLPDVERKTCQEAIPTTEVLRLEGHQQAAPVAPTVGYGPWPLCPLAQEAVEIGICESISHETVKQTLNNCMAGCQLQYGVILPKADGEYVAIIEDVLSTYDES